MAEVFRAGIQAIPHSQKEAAQSLNMSGFLAMHRVVLPQALRIVIPPIGNYFIALFKDSALVSVISVADLMRSGQLIASTTFKHFEIFTFVAILYLLISYPVSWFVSSLEQKFKIGSENKPIMPTWLRKRLTLLSRFSLQRNREVDLPEGLWAASTMIAAPLGTPELATHVLLLQFILVTEVIGLSLGGAASVRIARLIASQEMVRAKRVSILAIASGLVFSGLLAISLLLRFDLITSALFFLLPEQSEVIEGLSSLLPIVSIVLMLSTLFAITSACLLGYDEASSSLAAAIWCLWGIGVTSAFLFSQTQFGLNGLWFGLALGAGAATAVVLCSIRSRTREGRIHESP